MSPSACDPPTTAQTIGRLETGTRTVSVGWLNRIAKALGVEAQDLVEGSETAELKVAAILGPGGAMAPRKAAIVVAPRVGEDLIAVPSARAWATIARETNSGAKRCSRRIMAERSIVTCSSRDQRAASCSVA